jgi:hypothetical protein
MLERGRKAAFLVLSARPASKTKNPSVKPAVRESRIYGPTAKKPAAQSLAQ